MAERVKLIENPQLLSSVEFFSSGSVLLNLALGGGWPLGRVFNVVGDRSSGKTLVAIEAFANFIRAFPNGSMRYGESESAFDTIYAEKLGFPNTVSRPETPLGTVEEFSKDLETFCNGLEGPGLYILDSLDALSSDSEMARELGAATYGMEKAKGMSEMFRKIVRKLEEKKCTLGVISQIRDKIGVMFGETKTRSGGRALDFYCSEIVWLSEIEKLKHVVYGQDRITGVNVQAYVKKCKVGFPFRKVKFDITFGYGIDDQVSMLDWLLATKVFDKSEYTSRMKQLTSARNAADLAALQEIHIELEEKTKGLWYEIENSLAPPVSKYQSLR